MIRIFRVSAFVFLLLAGTAFGDATSYKPHATGFTLPNAQQAMSAQTASYATTAGSTGYATNAGTAVTAATATNAGFATSAGSAKTATSATSADSATFATNAGTASQAAGLTAGNNCPAGTALSVTKGVLGCVSSVTSITGTLDGSQITGDITNVGVVRTTGNIVAGGNLVSTGYVNGQNGLYSGNGVYATDYYGRGGGSNATFNGNASTSSSAVAVTGTVNGSQIVGNLNVGTINASGNIVSQGYTYGVGGLFSDSGVYSNSYAGRWADWQTSTATRALRATLRAVTSESCTRTLPRMAVVNPRISAPAAIILPPTTRMSIQRTTHSSSGVFRTGTDAKCLRR